jgi:hypothetical protein
VIDPVEQTFRDLVLERYDHIDQVPIAERSVLRAYAMELNAEPLNPARIVALGGMVKPSRNASAGARVVDEPPDAEVIEHLGRLLVRLPDADELQRAECLRAAELHVLARRMRQRALRGDADLARVNVVEQMALDAVAALRPLNPTPKPLEVRFIESPHAADNLRRQVARLESENRELRRQVPTRTTTPGDVTLVAPDHDIRSPPPKEAAAWAALSELNSRGGITPADPDAPRVVRMSDDPQANKMAVDVPLESRYPR